jgi:hypothetical protein
MDGWTYNKIACGINAGGINMNNDDEFLKDAIPSNSTTTVVANIPGWTTISGNVISGATVSSNVSYSNIAEVGSIGIKYDCPIGELHIKDRVNGVSITLVAAPEKDITAYESFMLTSVWLDKSRFNTDGGLYTWLTARNLMRHWRIIQ